jgi:hypothetical protein
MSFSVTGEVLTTQSGGVKSNSRILGFASARRSIQGGKL